eukprot:4679242-Prymnesium_polylepis.2
MSGRSRAQAGLPRSGGWGSGQAGLASCKRGGVRGMLCGREARGGRCVWGGMNAPDGGRRMRGLKSNMLFPTLRTWNLQQPACCRVISVSSFPHSSGSVERVL